MPTDDGQSLAAPKNSRTIHTGATISSSTNTSTAIMGLVSAPATRPVGREPLPEPCISSRRIRLKKLSNSESWPSRGHPTRKEPNESDHGGTQKDRKRALGGSPRAGPA